MNKDMSEYMGDYMIENMSEYIGEYMIKMSEYY